MSAPAPAHALRPGRGETVATSYAVVYIVVLVALPLAALVYTGFADGPGALWNAISAPVARSALWLTVWTATVVALVNAVLGTATAWVLARYRFVGRSALSALVDLPLAIPTLVAGIMLAALYGPEAILGHALGEGGITVLYAPLGIVLALLFVTLPFVVRAVEPVLEEIDPAEEEAAVTLGAGPWRVFRTVFLPAIAPAAISGAMRSLGRALGEFGAIVVVAGNIPMRTLTAPVYVFGEIESGAPHAAAAISVALLVLALAFHALARVVERRTGARRG